MGGPGKKLQAEEKQVWRLKGGREPVGSQSRGRGRRWGPNANGTMGASLKYFIPFDRERRKRVERERERDFQIMSSWIQIKPFKIWWTLQSFECTTEHSEVSRRGQSRSSQFAAHWLYLGHLQHLQAQVPLRPRESEYLELQTRVSICERPLGDPRCSKVGGPRGQSMQGVPHLLDYDAFLFSFYFSQIKSQD